MPRRLAPHRPPRNGLLERPVLRDVAARIPADRGSPPGNGPARRPAAHLDGADLDSADLEGTRLRGAGRARPHYGGLRGETVPDEAILKGANLAEADLEATSLKGTWPAGAKPHRDQLTSAQKSEANGIRTIAWHDAR
ncbi:hypothetical protein Ade02nite_59520 [Paractinoplanes deccanensis]|uniref:Pentapeptide repeat-containing protein n=1 Tax=Paractinoplanes deccanensis TaxID=113561 RepID=A0ABQ3YBG9_9ACTN|nr:hypothetical protein Ade02nite_59520 [Actinoplanes deccanensis]